MTETMDAEVVEIANDSTALATLNRSEIDMQIATAKRFPRAITKAKDDMIAMATIDKDTAERCGYALKRTDKDGKIVWIEGPSIRMAEIAVSCWGNLRYGARVVEETDRFVVAQGMCYDLEKNIASSMEVRRRITGRGGKKYGDDMIGTTANAACAIAARNAVFKIIPGAIVRVAYEAAMKTAGGDEKTFTKRRENAVAAFKEIGVTLEEIMDVLGKDEGGLEDIDARDLRRLFGLLTAIKDGETSVEQVLRPNNQNAEASKDRAAELNERLDRTEEPKTTTKAPDSTARTPAAGGEKHNPSPEAAGAAETPAAEVVEQFSGPWPEFAERLYNEAATYADPELPREVFDNGLRLAIVKLAKKGKEASISIPQRSKWFAAMKAGKFDYTTGQVKA